MTGNRFCRSLRSRQPQIGVAGYDVSRRYNVGNVGSVDCILDGFGGRREVSIPIELIFSVERAGVIHDDLNVILYEGVDRVGNILRTRMDAYVALIEINDAWRN